MTSEKLNQAVALIKTGNKPAALPVLKEIIQANPRDENAWLWLYACVDEVEQKKICLQKALEINPANLDAHVALGKLTDLTSWPVQQAALPKATQLRPVSKNNPATRRDGRYWLLTLGVAGLFMFACVIISGLYLAQPGQISALAASLPLFPSSTLTPSLTPTATATPSPTITPSPTATFGPEQIVPLEELESYRLEGKITMQGILAGDNATPFMFSFTQEWVKASLALHTIMSFQGSPALSGTIPPGQSSMTTTEIIAIGNTAWFKNLNEWTQIDSQQPLYQQNNLASPISSWQNLKPAGDEIINGIPCNHYTVDEDTLKMSGLGTSLGGQNITMHAQGDIWIANRPDLPSAILRMKIHMQVNGFIAVMVTGTPDPFMEIMTPVPQGVSYDYEYEITDVNTAITIEPPQPAADPEPQG
jgi:hypothetical protein